MVLPKIILNMKLLSITIFVLIIYQNSVAQPTIIWDNKKVIDFEYSTDSSLIYAALGKTISVYNIKEKKIIGDINMGSDIYKIAVSGDSNKLALALSDSTILLYNLTGSTNLFKIKNLNAIANSIKFISLGHTLLAGLRNGFLIVVDVLSGKIVKIIQAHTGEITAIALFESQSIFSTSGSDGNVCVWDLRDFKLLSIEHVHSNWVRNIVFNNDGSVLYSCGDDGKVIAYFLRNGIIRTQETESNNIFPQWILGIDYKSPNALAFSTLSGNVKVLLNNEIAYTFKLHSKIYKLKYFTNKDSRVILTVATDNGVQILDAKYFKSRF
jgi:WD40 repeat protein